jgi:hypothetical protein
MPIRFLLAALLVIGARPAHALEQRDLIVLRNDQKKLCFIETETVDGKLSYRNTAADKEPKQYRLGEVRSWEYAEMREGSWPKAVEARDAGRYANAADLFNQVSLGAKEWQKVYGAYHEGACFELLGDWPKAAEAFARALAVRPDHRLSLDAKYRQGFALARAKKNTEAGKIAAELEQLGKDRNAEAELRSHALKAVLAFNAGNADALKKEAKLALFRDDRDAMLHFGVFYAEALRQLKLPREAKLEYQRLMAVDLDPAGKVALSLGLAKVQLEDDKAGALATLLGLDALPYGSSEQKCEARFLAGKLLLEEIKAARAAAASDEAVIQFLRDQERTARLLLSAAAGSSSSISSRDLAKTELAAMGPDPDAPKAESAPAAPDAAQQNEPQPRK